MNITDVTLTERRGAFTVTVYIDGRPRVVLTTGDQRQAQNAYDQWRAKMNG